jgi:prepilin-type N-terminal cleavage/methylation domain-containing protein
LREFHDHFCYTPIFLSIRREAEKGLLSFSGDRLRFEMITNERGFTLVELLICIMVIGIIGAVAAPQFGGILRAYRLNGATKVVWGDLHKARLTAIKENRNIRVDFVGTSYNFVRVETGQVVFSRNLAADYPGITISISNDTVTFGSTGTAGGGGKTIQVQGSGGPKTFTILTTGRIGNFS